MEAPAARGRGRRRVLGVLAVGLAGLFVLALAYRPMSSVDLGYHLLYGQVTLETGEVVDDARFITPPPTPAADPADLPPGAWWDDQGRFRFPNANWLSQLALAATYRAGGWGGLVALQVLLVAVVLAAQAGIVRRLGLAWGWLGPIWLATGLLAYERFPLRPESFGYACLMVQLWLLTGPLSWRRVAGALSVQLLAANFHSYWLLGVGLGLALLGDAALRALWSRAVVGARQLEPALRRRLVQTGVLAVGLVAVAALHPAGVRNVVLPVQTLSFMRANAIAGTSGIEAAQQWQQDRMHPWALIGEFYRPLARGITDPRPGRTLVALLALGPLGAVVLAWRRQWWAVALLGAFLAISLSMRRNMAVTGMVLWPMVAWAAAEVARALRRRDAGPTTGQVLRQMALAGLAATALLAAWWTIGVVSNRFYVSTDRSWRFGSGVSQLDLPVGPAAFLDANLEPQPLFVDQATSSSIAFFARSARGVPLLTNTWATPVSRMREVIAITSGKAPLDPTARQWGMDVVVLKVAAPTRPLAQTLVASPDWALVYAETWYAVFARRTDANAALIAGHELTSERFDLDVFLADCRSRDPVEVAGLRAGASLLHGLGWLELAEPAWRTCLAHRDDWPGPWLNLGLCRVTDGEGRLAAGDPTGEQAVRQAEEHFLHALQRQEDYAQAWLNLGNLRLNRAVRGLTARGPRDPAALADLASAEQCLSRALEILPELDQARQLRDLARRQMQVTPPPGPR